MHRGYLQNRPRALKWKMTASLLMIDIKARFRRWFIFTMQLLASWDVPAGW
jgi:hypothetical protein